jgi:hypothetical protein
VSDVENFDYKAKLEECFDFASIFKLVKHAVRRYLGAGRAGLMLGLSDLPGFIGGYWVVGSNMIVINRLTLNKVMKEAGDRRLINAYVFDLLLHEYLHSLGHLQEQETRDLSSEICRQALGGDHPASIIASNGPTAVFPGLNIILNIDPRQYSAPSDVEIIGDFDRESTSYIS